MNWLITRRRLISDLLPRADPLAILPGDPG